MKEQRKCALILFYSDSVPNIRGQRKFSDKIRIRDLSFISSGINDGSKINMISIFGNRAPRLKKSSDIDQKKLKDRYNW